MEKRNIKIGAFYDWGGDVVKVIEIIDDGIVIECPENGQDVAKPSRLKELEARTSEPLFYDY